jgi:hypothetical protein
MCAENSTMMSSCERIEHLFTPPLDSPYPQHIQLHNTTNKRMIINSWQTAAAYQSEAIRLWLVDDLRRNEWTFRSRSRHQFIDECVRVFHGGAKKSFGRHENKRRWETEHLDNDLECVCIQFGFCVTLLSHHVLECAIIATCPWNDNHFS